MAKRPISKPEDADNDLTSGQPVSETIAPDVAKAITSEQAAQGQSDEAEPSTENEPRHINTTAGAAQENPSQATAPDVPVSGDGGLVETDPAALASAVALEAAVAAIKGDQAAIIPKGMTIEFLSPGQMVQVTGPKKGRRRIGRDFGREPVLIPIDDLSGDDLAALRGDPTLTVEITQITIPGRETGGQPVEIGTTR